MSFSNFNTPLPTRNNNRIPNPNNDAIVNDPPSDSIQALKWSPNNQNLLACASWDCTVRAYSIDNQSGSSSVIGEYKNSSPALDVGWTSDGNNIISAGCDKIIKMWNPNQSTPLVIGYHDKPIRNIEIININNGEQIISGGWDKELKYWDIRQSISYNNDNYENQLKPIGSLTLSERVYAMDAIYPLLCIALANKKVVIFDIRNPSKPIKEMITLLKHQLRCISIFPDQKGFAVGSVEGRCAIHYVVDQDTDKNHKNFAFKCHRKQQNVYAVNSLQFHNKFGTFSSAGGDGTIYFWDKDKKQKLKEFKQMDLPVTDIDFNHDGTLFAYSISYDWSKGIEHFKPKKQKPQIFIHKLEPNEIRPKND